MIELIGKLWKISCDPVTGQCLVTFALQNADRLGRQSMRGIRCQKCILIKPSHEYNSAEMAKLIRGTIEEEKWLGIETIPPEELKRMMEALEEHERRTQMKQENKSM